MSAPEGVGGSQVVALVPPEPEVPRRLVLGEAFLTNIYPPSWACKPILQMGQVVAITAPTNHGKSAFAFFLMACFLLGGKVGPFEFRRGKVLFLLGENIENAKIQAIAALRFYGVPDEVWKANAVFYPYSKPLEKAATEVLVEAIAREYGPFVFVNVDTLAAYYGGDDENSNTQMREHAASARKLTSDRLGRPCVAINCHPVKKARGELVPKGGSSFLNEIDSNLTLWREDDMLEVGNTKLRGPPFEAFQLALKQQQVGYSDGTTGMLSVACPLSDEELKEALSEHSRQEVALLEAMRAMPEGTQTEWAVACGWKLGDGKPNKMMVGRTLLRLTHEGKVKKAGAKWRVV